MKILNSYFPRQQLGSGCQDQCWEFLKGLKIFPNIGQVQWQSHKLPDGFLVLAVSAFASTCFWQTWIHHNLECTTTLPFSSIRLPSSDLWRVFLKLTCQSMDTSRLRRLSKARRPWDKGLHMDTVQSIRLQPAEHKRVVSHTLRPLGQGIANSS